MSSKSSTFPQSMKTPAVKRNNLYAFIHEIFIHIHPYNEVTLNYLIIKLYREKQKNSVNVTNRAREQ